MHEFDWSYQYCPQQIDFRSKKEKITDDIKMIIDIKNIDSITLLGILLRQLIRHIFEKNTLEKSAF